MDKIEVMQADREAASDAVEAYRDNKSGDWQKRIRNGECDDGYMVQAFARHRLATRTDATPVAFISAERLNRKREFEANGAVVYDRPLGTSTMPLYTHPPATDVAALVEAAKAFMDRVENYMAGLIRASGTPQYRALRQALAPFTKGQNDDAVR